MAVQTAAFHLAKAREAMARNNRMQAYALLKTFQALYEDIPPGLDIGSHLLDEEELLDVNPASFARNKRCANIIQDRARGGRVSVVDIGGGAGLLAHFIPKLGYLLCEPSVNGLYAEDLLEMGVRSDVAVCVHVIEHVQRDARKGFIENLLKISDCVIVNCPVANGHEYKRSAQELIYKHTKAEWALEHMECTLPSIEDMLEIGQSLQSDVESFPGSHFAATLGYVFLHQIASESADPWTQEYYREIKQFINKRCHLLDSPVPSGDHFFIFSKASAAEQAQQR